ncbi:hypothetical protein ACGFX4_37125 [Kitasatospora sp. NPDC048365]|uniref:hypothetical protein n=1 Tax=Kitasatospora sp. NPDC048365 TaxID=3364050 RepID=UPI003711D66E
MTSNHPGRIPLDSDGADSLRVLAAQERGRAEQLATFLEDVADRGLPSLEECQPWEELRERRLSELAGGTGEQHVG